MFRLVFVGLITAVFLVEAGVLFGGRSPQLFSGISFLLIGIFTLYVFADVSRSVLNTGSPVAHIVPGTYKVGFVYLAGENVSIGIEKTREKKEERLFLYQFPAKDFEGEIRIGARKLVAVKLIAGEGTFDRYKLE